MRELLLSSTILLTASTGLMAAEPAPLPGEFVIQTMLKGTYLTAVDGGGRTDNVIRSDATRIGSWEKFRLLGGGEYGPFRAVNTSSRPPEETTSPLWEAAARQRTLSIPMRPRSGLGRDSGSGLTSKVGEILSRPSMATTLLRWAAGAKQRTPFIPMLQGPVSGSTFGCGSVAIWDRDASIRYMPSAEPCSRTAEEDV